MKKLMIAAAIVCAAVVSHGAAFTWKTSGSAYAVPAGTKLVDGQTYDAGTTTMKSVASTWTWTAMIALTLDTQNENIKLDALAYNINKIQVKDISSTLFSLPTDDGVTKTYAYSIVITGTDSEGNTLTSNTITGSDNFTKASAATFTTSGPASWTYKAAEDPGPEPTPEPTSGLLMLIGMAGLALRRKAK